MAHSRIAILWTIVIVFISQLFHCAYTNEREQQILHQQQASKQIIPFGLSNQQQQQQHFRHIQNQRHEAAEMAIPAERETYEELLSASSAAGSGAGNLDLPTSEEAPRQQSARERCRELISLTLLSFRDLSADERATEEIDCANLREQIAAASGTSRHSTSGGSQRSRAKQVTTATPAPPLDDFQSEPGGATQSSDEFPLAPNYANNSPEPLPAQISNKPRGSARAGQHFPLIENFNLSSTPKASNIQPSSWQPKGPSYINQMQQLLILQHQQRQRLQNQENLQPLIQFLQQQQQQVTTTTTAPTTQSTTFESLFETTSPPTTTTSTTTTTTTTTTTSTTTTTPAPPQQPKLRVAGGRRKPKLIKSTTTTTTTTTTTAKPQDDYLDDTEAPGGEEEEDYDQATTTTTTTRAPRRSGQKKNRRRTTTTPKPTTTTLSPGYQPRPDGRIIDYMADPNFPRELKGADLTNYPFYITVPEKIDFDCKGRHDGYYTNINLHCQIYHHCAIGNRYDFLCPNYTLFDQTTFTCRFINTVDCPGSEKHFDRNNALYVEKDSQSSSQSSSTSTTSPTSTTTTSTSSPQNVQPIRLNIQVKPPRTTPAPVSALSIIQQPGGQASGRRKRTIGGHQYR